MSNEPEKKVNPTWPVPTDIGIIWLVVFMSLDGERSFQLCHPILSDISPPSIGNCGGSWPVKCYLEKNTKSYRVCSVDVSRRDLRFVYYRIRYICISSDCLLEFTTT